MLTDSRPNSFDRSCNNAGNMHETHGVSIQLGLAENFLINTACLDVTKHMIKVTIYTPS